MSCFQALLILCTLFVSNFAQLDPCVRILGTTGSDSNSCGTISNPCLTLSYVLTRIDSSCQTNTISILSGTYSGAGNENVIIHVNGSLILQGNTSVTFRTDKTVPIISIDKGNNKDVTFQGILFTRSLTVGPACVKYYSNSNLRFIDCKFNCQGEYPTVEITIMNSTTISERVNIEFTRVRFEDCTVIDTPLFASGAAISVMRSDMHPSPNYKIIIVKITNCTFISNLAKGIGGAVRLEGVSTIISGTLFVNNTAGLDGGALYVNGGSLEAFNNTFIDNKANGSGGALYLNLIDILSMNDSYIESNTAKGNGGGIYVSMTRILDSDSKINLETLVIKQNQAQQGGGIWIASTVSGPAVFFFFLERLLIESNRAINGTGGGFFITNEGLVMMSNSQIFRNYANLGGGGGSCDVATRVSGKNISFSYNTANNICLNDISGACYDFIASPCAQKQQHNNCNNCTDDICSIDDKGLVHCFGPGADLSNCLCNSPPPNPPDSNLGWIIGGSVVGAIVLVILVVIIVTRSRRATEYEPLGRR